MRVREKGCSCPAHTKERRGKRGHSFLAFARARLRYYNSSLMGDNVRYAMKRKDGERGD